MLATAQAAGSIEPRNQRQIADLKHELADARLDVRDYELAETRVEQSALAGVARKRLNSVQHGILDASQYNIVSAIEVAHLSALIAQLQEQLV